MQIEFAITAEGSVFEGFDDGNVRILQIGVFAHQSD
jgi:hypothetical protein